MDSSGKWRDYYERNADALLEIPWHAGRDLTILEREAIAASVQGFQAGESSEGRHLYRYAKQYAERSGDWDYLAAIKLFIAEEQWHARDLARFLQQNDIPTLKTTFPDRVFRRLRHLFGGLEASIAVLITAEIIAKVYYAALLQATNSPVLRTLCEQILRDELKHVEFQAEKLGELRSGRNPLLLWITLGLQRFLYWGTCIVVWQFHHRALRKGDFGFWRYWRTCWMEFDAAFAIAKQTSSEMPAQADIIGEKENIQRH